MPEVRSEMDIEPVAVSAILSDLSDRKIRSFLAGDSNGSELLEALYGDTIDEPMPGRLTALLRQ